MARAFAVVLLIVALSAPRDVAAGGGGGGIPLASWCNSPAMTACFNVTEFFAYDILDEYAPSMFVYVMHTQVNGYLSGSDLPEFYGYNVITTIGYESLSYGRQLHRNGGVCESGFLDCVVDGHELYLATGPNYAWGYMPTALPTFADYAIVEASINGVNVWACSPNGEVTETWLSGKGVSAIDPCYVVPEPGSLLLLATGLIPLGLVGWRRRRAA